MAVVDTEEEFDWSAPFDRNATGVGHMRRIHELQAVFDRHGIRPVYAVGTPIATTDVSIEALRPILADNRALIGTHLHPWVTPPLTEEVCGRNSFPCNLDYATEAAKIRTLTDQITAAFGQRPVIYKAGRYGADADSFAILERLGYQVDISPRPPFDYRAVSGPDFSRRGNDPRWEGPNRKILSIPNSGAFVGRLARPALAWIGDLAMTGAAQKARLPGILARLDLLERLSLSPEGYTDAEMRRLVRFQHAAGQDVFMLCLHSPSVAPGHTPYVRTESEQAAFLATLDRFLAWFRNDMRGVPDDPLRLHAAMADARTPTATAPAAARQTVTVRPILREDLPELAAYWRANLNPAIDIPTWTRAFSHDWLPDPPNHGFRLLAGDRLVGALGAIYSRQSFGAESADFCNLTSLVVDEAFRARSMDLVSACLSQKQFRFTNFTPTPSVARMLRLFRFRELRSGLRLVMNSPVPAWSHGLRIIGTNDTTGPDGPAGRVWRDHQDLPSLHRFAIGRGDEWCAVFWRPSVIKGLPGAHVLGFSDPALFVRWHRPIGGHLLLRHGVVGMRIEEHLLPPDTRLGICRPVTMPRMYRGPEMAQEHVPFLYSELVALPL